MRTICFLLQKEFRQIFRNRAILMLILVMPIMQLIILPLAADYEIKNINLSVVDHDHSPYSRQLISKITASGYFRLQGYHTSLKAAYRFIEQDRAALVLEIPHGFERNLIREGKQPLYIAINAINCVQAGLGGAYIAHNHGDLVLDIAHGAELTQIREGKQPLFIAINAINGVKAGLGGAYLANIIGDYNQDIRITLTEPTRFSAAPTIDVVPYNRFNPMLN